VQREGGSLFLPRFPTKVHELRRKLKNQQHLEVNGITFFTTSLLLKVEPARFGFKKKHDKGQKPKRAGSTFSNKYTFYVIPLSSTCC
jgi:hypothetical protein